MRNIYEYSVSYRLMLDACADQRAQAAGCADGDWSGWSPQIGPVGGLEGSAQSC